MQELLVITDASDPADQAREQAEAVLRHWPGGERPAVAVTPIDRVLAEPVRLERAGAAWMIVGPEPGDTLYELFGVLIERQVPALLTRRGDTQPAGCEYSDGIVLCPPHTPATTAAAMLSSLWSQAATIAQLKREAQALSAQHGGLTDYLGQLDEELRLAAELQREFLPHRMPTVSDLAVRVLWRPAGYVSGDIYDVIRLDEHHLGLFLADAVGHGVPAALLTMYIKRSLFTKQIDPTLPGGYQIVQPGHTLAALNRDLVARNDSKVRFTTACYAVLDTGNLTLSIARAGHPFPILLRGDGATQPLDPDGALLGVFPDETFEQQDLQLEPGDRLVLYSDGFETAFDADADPAGKGRIASTRYTQEFEAFRHGSLDEALERFAAKLDRQQGSLNQLDDLTALCLEIGAVPQEREADHGIELDLGMELARESATHRVGAA